MSVKEKNIAEDLKGLLSIKLAFPIVNKFSKSTNHHPEFVVILKTMPFLAVV